MSIAHLKVVPMSKAALTSADFHELADEHELEAKERRAEAHKADCPEADFVDLMAAASALDITAARYRRIANRGHRG